MMNSSRIAVFQAMGHGFFSLIMSVIRQLVVLLPAAYILLLYITAALLPAIFLLRWIWRTI